MIGSLSCHLCDIHMHPGTIIVAATPMYLFRFIEFMAFVLPFKGYWVQGFDFWWFLPLFLSFSCFKLTELLRFLGIICHGHVLFSSGSGWMLQKSLLGWKEGKRNAGFHGRRHCWSWVIIIIFLSWPFPCHSQSCGFWGVHFKWRDISTVEYSLSI